jgi:hypothetical protein
MKNKPSTTTLVDKRSNKSISLIFALIGLVSGANGAVVVSVAEVGGDVVISSAGGSLNLTAWSGLINNNGVGVIEPNVANFRLGPTTNQDFDWYTSVTLFSGPTSIGNAFATFPPDSHAGATYGIAGNGWLFVPDNYVSGSTLGASTMTFENETLSSLGVTPGFYTWSWGSGASADTLSLQVIPEPSITVFILAGTLVLFGRRRKS